MAALEQDRSLYPETTTTSDPLRAETAAYSRRQVLLTMAGLLLALLFAALDGTIVNTALPRIIGELHGFDRYTWVATAYMVTATVVIPIYGKLSDLIGRKVIFLGCLIIFLVGSALCGAAQSLDQLIVFRAFQGLGAGGIMPVAMASFADLLTPRERARWQGGFMSIMGISSILGPILGGWITDHTSWRWVFYVNLPFGLLALLGLTLVMPALRYSDAQPRIDFLGAGLLIVGLAPLLLGLSWAGSLYPWLSVQIVGLLGGGLAVMALFIGHEIRLERRDGEPIIAPSLFANRAFSVSLLSIMIAFMGMVGSVAFLPLYAQGVLRISATNSGLVLTPMMLSVIAASMIAGALAARSNAYRLVAITGMALAIVGALLLLRLDLHTGYRDMVIAIIGLGAGLGCGFPVYGAIIMNALPANRRGQGMASFDFFQEMGGPLALAVLGPVLATRYAPAYHAALSPTITRHLSPRIVRLFDKPDILLNPHALQSLTAQLDASGQRLLAGVLDAVRIGLFQSIHAVFLGSLAIQATGMLVVLFLPHVDIPDEASATAPTETTTGTALAADPRAT